ncbi:hypothetical protein ABHM93_01335 [Micromonospora provocatoris]|uniref:hypothetical protein n=1 Tax=Micromonospora provocatoris TaxID=322610 RepID=UPI003D2B53C5
MEQLIIIAIIAIVSSLFGKSKNKKEQKPMPPFNKTAPSQPSAQMEVDEPTHRRPTTKRQSFEDFAREFVGELKTEFATENATEKRLEPVREKVKEHIPSYVAPPLIPTEQLSRKTERPSIGRLAAEKKDISVATSNNGFQIPNSQKALVQAVVMAEILGPPKAKRK